jgi:hypothetical protein
MKKSFMIVALMLLASAALAQKVNFTGEWKLNEGKSTLGKEFSMAPAFITVTHTRKTLDLKTTNVWNGQQVVNESHFTLNGKETENVGFGETPTNSTAEANKKTRTLKVFTRGSSEGIGDWTSTQILSMQDGQLVIDFTAASDMGEITESYVFDKQ